MKCFKLLVAVFSLLTIVAVCKASSITCETPRRSHVLQLDEDAVLILKRPYASGQPVRQPSSINRTRGSRLQRVIHFEGNRYSIRIEDLERFDETADKLVIRTSAGHEMTYPIQCQKN